MSSRGVRLRPLGFEVKKENTYLSKAAGWFLDDKADNIDSSDFLEVALNEFFVQGLELDLCAVLWDSDFRYSAEKKDWLFFEFGKRQWKEVVDEDVTRSRKESSKQKKIEENRKKEIKRFYMRNAYRVLLTRARNGMVICVPEGDKSDDTRLPEFYNPTFEYLKSLGFEDL